MKTLLCSLLAFVLILGSGCATSHYKAVTENGDEVIVHDLDGGSLLYYPGMVVWDCGVAWPVTIAEFYASAAVFMPIALLTDDGRFVGCPEMPFKAMKWIVFEHHPPFLPMSEIDYEIEQAEANSSHGWNGRELIYSKLEKKSILEDNIKLIILKEIDP